ncbi:hypothetical protein PCASD_20740 [Puccinia coronata f. sp. avenae]|uniref:Uncharacterized protein n=1 Tax=Puccinia coronata f. sp. avenae TaxID=200324 RepID=A0A2N5SES0_9BASI|nr:hypothetical protein PCASD_20740 [Puccinia coronata f. sp. avenae]
MTSQDDSGVERPDMRTMPDPQAARVRSEMLELDGALAVSRLLQVLVLKLRDQHDDASSQLDKMSQNDRTQIFHFAARPVSRPIPL